MTRAALGTLRANWPLIVASMLIAVAVATVVSVRKEPQYLASTQVFTTQAREPVYPYGWTPEMKQESPLPTIDQINIDQLLIALRQDASVEEISAATGYPWSARLLAAVLRVAPVPQTSVLQITAKTTDPQVSAALVDAAADRVVRLVIEGSIVPGDSGGPYVSADALGPALVPGSPLGESPLLSLVGAALAGLITGVTAALLRTGVWGRETPPEALAELVGAPLLGLVPDDVATLSEPLSPGARSGPTSAALERIASNIVFGESGRGKRILSFASLHRFEGRTSAVANLAVHLAWQGLRVTVVEADLRSPALLGYLDVIGPPPEHGLVDVLAGAASGDDAVRETQCPGLKLLPSGAAEVSPIEVCGGDGLPALLGTLSDQCDLVLVDTPCLAQGAEAAFVAAAGDGVILLVPEGPDAACEVRTLTSRMQDVSAVVVGVIVTMTQQEELGDDFWPRADPRPGRPVATGIAGGWSEAWHV